jgi:hypothetical protein
MSRPYQYYIALISHENPAGLGVKFSNADASLFAEFAAQMLMPIYPNLNARYKARFRPGEDAVVD